MHIKYWLSRGESSQPIVQAHLLALKLGGMILEGYAQNLLSSCFGVKDHGNFRQYFWRVLFVLGRAVQWCAMMPLGVSTEKKRRCRCGRISNLPLWPYLKTTQCHGFAHPLWNLPKLIHLISKVSSNECYAWTSIPLVVSPIVTFDCQASLVQFGGSFLDQVVCFLYGADFKFNQLKEPNFQNLSKLHLSCVTEAYEFSTFVEFSISNEADHDRFR